MNTISKSRADLTILLSVCLTLLTAAIWFVLVGREVSASSDSVDTVSLTVPIACTMTGEGTSHTATLDPGTYSGATGSEYENGIGKTTLTAICNDDNGFSIYAIGYTGNSYDLENHTKLVGSTTGGTIATKAYASEDTTSNWSMRLAKVTDSTISYNPQNLGISIGYDTWHAVPDAYTKVAEYHANTGSSTTDTTLGVKLETTYAAYISSSQPADTYVGQVKYTLVHPYDELPPVRCRPDGTTISTITCMQDVQMTNRDSVLASMNEGQQYTLYDKRDKKPYTVARLADGNIWMTQNLDLDIDSNTTYTNEDTDIGYVQFEDGGEYLSASWKPVFSTIKGDTSAWWSSTIAPISYDPGDLYFDPTYRDTQLFMLYIVFSEMEEYQSFLPEFVAMFPVDIQEFIASCDADFIECDETLLASEHQTIKETYKMIAYSISCQNGTCNAEIYDSLSPEWKEYVGSCGADMTNCDSTLIPVSNYGENGASLTTGIPQHHIGNYYNWTAALAENYSGDLTSTGKAIEQSICPSGWTLPRGDEEEDSFYAFLNQYGYVVNPADMSSNAWWNEPLYLIPAGAIAPSIGDDSNAKSLYGYYWSATSYSPTESYGLKFTNMGQTYLTEKLAREKGYSVRCVARPVRYIPDSGGGMY